MTHTVLLIDDDQNVLHGLARALHQQPYRLYTTTSSEEAMYLLKSRDVDVVVADEHMPGMRGGELLAWVASHRPEVMRIVLTGYPTAETAIRAINEGRVFQFFTKPCNPAHLGIAIRKALEQKDSLDEKRRLATVHGQHLDAPEGQDTELDLVDKIVCEDIQSPLDTLLQSSPPLEPQACEHAAVTERRQLERVRDAAAEVRRLVDEMNERCRKEMATVGAGTSCSDKEPADNVGRD